MEDFLDQGLSKSQLERLNACRMYLQVTMLSKITDHTGTELLPQVLTNRVTPTPKGLANISQSTLTWPHIHPPVTSVLAIMDNHLMFNVHGFKQNYVLDQPSWCLATGA